ncbi:hypothetical protein ACIBKY_04750 [Nonomuraea sp. NPDC050394]|uniref:hypothetical protein n=1 Tax=Nonomuraea sp. NPDC050394 TaxID=3364363 RepID=UPI00378D8101
MNTPEARDVDEQAKTQTAVLIADSLIPTPPAKPHAQRLRERARLILARWGSHRSPAARAAGAAVTLAAGIGLALRARRSRRRARTR